MAKRSTPQLTPADLMKQNMEWYQHSLKWWEMMTASSMTIAMRMSGMTAKWQNNQPQDMAEMWRMVAEKNQAVMQSAQAAGRWNSKERPKLAKAFGCWPMPLTPNEWATEALHTQWLLGASALKALSSTMAPFHKASTANAFRLSGTRKPGTK